MRVNGLQAAAVAALISLSACSPKTGTVEQTGAAKAEAPAPFQVERSAVYPVKSTVLNRGYEVYVKTPPGYDAPENAGRRYPVINLTDGPYTFQVASGVTRVPFNQGLLQEFILVGVSYGEGEEPADSRSRDLTPWVDPAIKRPTGGAPDYLKFLKSEVLPLVEQRYRIDAAQRTLSGQSYGALFGLWVAMTEPELFSNYILTSPSIWFAKRSILETEAAFAGKHKDLKARIYMATGEREHPGEGGCRSCKTDMVADQQNVVKLLESRNYPGLELRTDVIRGAYHETTYPVGLLNGLQWFYLKP